MHPKKLYFIVGKRKSGTSLLFRSVSSEVWKPSVKDRSWREVEDSLFEFLKSSSKVGLIAKADALLDPERLINICNKSNLEIVFIFLDRDPKKRFISFVLHQAKKNVLPLNNAVNFFLSEESCYDSGLSLLKNYPDYEIEFSSFEDIIKNRFPPFFSDLGYEESLRKTNSSSESYRFYRLASGIANSKFYSSMSNKKIVIFLRNKYFYFFKRTSFTPYNKIILISREREQVSKREQLKVHSLGEMSKLFKSAHFFVSPTDYDVFKLFFINFLRKLVPFAKRNYMIFDFSPKFHLLKNVDRGLIRSDILIIKKSMFDLMFKIASGEDNFDKGVMNLLLRKEKGQ